MTHESILAHAGAEPGFVGPEAYTVLGASIYEKGYKIRYKSKYLFRMRKKITTIYRF